MAIANSSFGGLAVATLRNLIARIERLHEERQALADDVKEVYAEAKGHGFDTKIMKQVVKLRRLDKADLDEQNELLDLYMAALGAADEPTHDLARETVNLPAGAVIDAKGGVSINGTNLGKLEATVEAGRTRITIKGGEPKPEKPKEKPTEPEAPPQGGEVDFLFQEPAT